MGRRERPLTPGPLHDFARDLRELRAGTGHTYRALGRIAGYAPSALSAAASGDSLPTPEVLRAYVRACGGDAASWEERRRQLAALLSHTDPGLPSEVPPVPQAPAAESPPPEEGAEPRQSAAAPALPVAGPASRPKRRAARSRPLPVKFGLGPLILAGAIIISYTILRATGSDQTLLPTAPPRGSGPTSAQTTPNHAGGRDPGTPTAILDAPPGTTALVAGPGCAPSQSSSFASYNDPGSFGWHGTPGGWTGNGCHGLADYTRLAGWADTWAQDASWIFQVPAGRSCLMSVYIPRTSRAGGLAQYDVYRTFANHTVFDSRVTTITVNQAAHRGDWVTAGPFTFPHAIADMEATDRGVGHADIAISAVGITCR